MNLCWSGTGIGNDRDYSRERWCFLIFVHDNAFGSSPIRQYSNLFHETGKNCIPFTALSPVLPLSPLCPQGYTSPSCNHINTSVNAIADTGKLPAFFIVSLIAFSPAISNALSYILSLFPATCLCTKTPPSLPCNSVQAFALFYFPALTTGHRKAPYGGRGRSHFLYGCHALERKIVHRLCYIIC